MNNIEKLAGNCGEYVNGEYFVFYPNELEAFAKALQQSSEPVAIKAKKIEWQHERDNWYDSDWGLHVYIDREEKPESQYVASWGERDQENFATFEEAEDWCQRQINSYIYRVAEVDDALVTDAKKYRFILNYLLTEKGDILLYQDDLDGEILRAMEKQNEHE